MNHFFKKITSFFASLFTPEAKEKRAQSRAVRKEHRYYTAQYKYLHPTRFQAYRRSEPHRRRMAFMSKWGVFFHIPFAMFIVLIMEWLSRHSLVSAFSFIVEHPGPFLYNTYLVWCCLTIVFLFSFKQSFVRFIVAAIFIGLGVTNCIILANRVTPFGFTDFKMIGDLFTMTGTHYVSLPEILLIIGLFVFFFILFIHQTKPYKPKEFHHWMPLWARIFLIAAAFVSVPITTNVLIKENVLAGYFGNLAQGYSDYGFLYGFYSSVFNRGMSKPRDYSASAIDAIIETDQDAVGSSTLDAQNGPNIIVVLLESAYDPEEVSYLHLSDDPLPTLHSLEKNYSWGHLTVPVVGAGTCNTEFEMLTGMSCSFLGPGEYPQKTVLKHIDRCESYASDLKTVGYGSHVVHNNGGNFYSRANAFSLMGFDTFTCKEMLDITDYTPLGNWPTDDILIDATADAMDSTPQSDFVYTITVSTHGEYPEYPVLTDPKITVTCDGKTEEQTNAWTYYVNQLNAMDQWVADYISMLSSRDEDTLLIMFGDHLPTMGLTNEETAQDDLFQTKYWTWNNFGMSKEDMDLTSYQLVAEYLNRLDFHDGTMLSYHQRMLDNGTKAGTTEYMRDLESLQYDLLYGKRYAYDGQDLYPATDIEMGIQDVTIDSAYFFDGKLHIYGQNFTKWSKVYVNGEKVNTTYESGQHLTVDADLVQDGDSIVVCQVGSSNTIFRSSNTYTVSDPAALSNERKTAAEDDTSDE